MYTDWLAKNELSSVFTKKPARIINAFKIGNSALLAPPFQSFLSELFSQVILWHHSNPRVGFNSLYFYDSCFFFGANRQYFSKQISKSHTLNRGQSELIGVPHESGDRGVDTANAKKTNDENNAQRSEAYTSLEWSASRSNTMFQIWSTVKAKD